ncbi:MAG: hypothetical protein GF355_02450 [Candidatus Eisenbacteria bacterium]|nr:hypothetical protein [Candidatus Eisenbacteria bacterium]
MRGVAGMRPIELARGLAAVFLLGMAHGPAHAEAPVRDGAELFQKVRAWILALPALEAPFIQVNHWTGWGESAPDTARGTLYLERPCCFQLDYSDPEGHLVTCDGESLWTYVPELSQVVRTPVPEAGVGAGDLFMWLVHAAEPDSAAYPVDPPIYRLGVEPPEAIGWRWLEIRVHAGDGSIQGYRYEDLQENETAFTFLEFDAAVRRGPEAFGFETPPGVEIVDVH